MFLTILVVYRVVNILIEPDVRLFVDIEGAGLVPDGPSALGVSKPIVLGQSFGGFVAQRYLARHPQHPARVILSSTSAQLGLARKLAMFERLGGPEARDAAERFWTAPDAATYGAYVKICKPLYSATLSTGKDAAQRAVTGRLENFESP